MRNVLISIKPEFVKLIFSGEKLFEYRKRVPSKVDIALVYVTAPIKRIVGEFKITKILSMSPEQLWQETYLQSGLSHEQFLTYFGNSSVAYALAIDNANLYDSPIELSDINIKRAPQSWQYLD